MDGFSVDLGGTKTAAARIKHGQIEARLQLFTETHAAFDAQLDALTKLLTEIGFCRGERLAVAVAGRVDMEGHWLPVNTATLSGIKGEPLLDHLRDRFGPRVSVINDAAAAALGEAKLGAGVGADHFAYLTVSTGVGGGIVLDGKLLQSRNGMAGHVGFMRTPSGRDLCGSGRVGTVESVASGRAIAYKAGTKDAQSAFASNTLKNRIAIERSASTIAGLCTDLTAMFGLDRIAIGGSVGLAEDYLARVKGHLDRQPRLFRVPVIHARLGHDSALLGSLLLPESTSR